MHIHLSVLTLLVACNGSTPNLPDAARAPDAGAADASVADASVADAAAVDAFVPAPVVIASGEARPESIAVFDGTVYWTTATTSGSGQVRKASTGQAVETIATNEAQPLALAVGNGLVEPTAFWGTGAGELRQIAASGAPPLAITSVNDFVLTMTLDGDTVFAGTRGAVVAKHVGSASSLSVLASGYGNGVTAIAADATGVVFGARTFPSDAWIVAAVARTGGPVTTLYTGAALIRGVAISGSQVFWIEDRTLMAVPRAGGSSVIVKTFPGPELPWSLTASGGTLYVALNQGVLNPSGATGSIVAIDALTLDVRMIADAQLEPTDVAADASFVYWTNRGIAAHEGTIMRIRR